MISERERELLKRLLSEPDEFPDEFKEWLGKHLEFHPPGFLLSDFTVGSGTITNLNLVPATGVLADMPPGRELVYNEVASDTAITATAEATADPIVTASSFTFDGVTPVWVEGWFADASSASAWTLNLVLRDDTAGVSIGLLGVWIGAAGASSGPLWMRRKLTPASGARVYSIRAFRTTANGSVNAGTGGAAKKMPGFIRITKG